MKDLSKMAPLFEKMLHDNLDRLKAEKPFMERHAAVSTLRLLQVDNLALEDVLILSFLFGGVIATYHDEMMEQMKAEDVG